MTSGSAAELHALPFFLCGDIFDWSGCGPGGTHGSCFFAARTSELSRLAFIAEQVTRAGSCTPQVKAFMGELDRVDTHGTICTTPLLLNLMLREYIRHEAKGSAIQFDGDTALCPAPVGCSGLHLRPDRQLESCGIGLFWTYFQVVTLFHFAPADAGRARKAPLFCHWGSYATRRVPLPIGDHVPLSGHDVKT